MKLNEFLTKLGEIVIFNAALLTIVLILAGLFAIISNILGFLFLLPMFSLKQMFVIMLIVATNILYFIDVKGEFNK